MRSKGAVTVHQCDDCGAVVLGKGPFKVHQGSCHSDTHHNTPNDDNEDFAEFLDWLTTETEDGEIKFKGKAITDQVGFSTKQIGVFMNAVEDREEFTVERLGYSSSTLWEVRQA